jgi:hypothetical protein
MRFQRSLVFSVWLLDYNHEEHEVHEVECIIYLFLCVLRALRGEFYAFYEPINFV